MNNKIIIKTILISIITIIIIYICYKFIRHIHRIKGNNSGSKELNNVNSELIVRESFSTSITKSNLESKFPVNLIDMDLGSDSEKYHTSVLAKNGNIYATPDKSNKVLEFNPSTGKIKYIGPDLGNDEDKYETSVLARNDKIYAVPENASRVLEIDPTGDTVTIQFIGSDLPGDDKYETSVLAGNGKIYAVPENAEQVLEINPRL